METISLNEKEEIVNTHVERISRFKDNLRPFDYPRLKEYAQELLKALDSR